jgi:hypothetical protein
MWRFLLLWANFAILIDCQSIHFPGAANGGSNHQKPPISELPNAQEIPEVAQPVQNNFPEVTTTGHPPVAFISKFFT